MGRLLEFPQAAGSQISTRVLQRLWEAQEKERHPHFRDDIMTAWYTVLFASTDSLIPDVEACYKVFFVPSRLRV